MKSLRITHLILSMLVLTMLSYGQSTDARLEGKWKMTDAWVVAEDNTRDASESAAVKADLIEKSKIEYQFSDGKLSIFTQGSLALTYGFARDASGKISVDIPMDQAFQLMFGLQIVELDVDRMVLKSYSSDNSNGWIYQEFYRPR